MHLIEGQYVLVWYFSLHALFYILFFLWTRSFSMKFSIMTSQRYCDVTHFLTDSNENCTAYVKLNSKIFLWSELFWFSEYLLRKLRFFKKIPSIVQLPYTSPPIPFGPPIRVSSVRDTSFTYLRLLSQHKNKQKIIVFTKNGENQGRSLSSFPFGPHLGGGGSSTRSPLIFWDAFPPYLRMLFQKKIFFCNFWLKFGVIVGSIPLKCKN